MYIFDAYNEKFRIAYNKDGDYIETSVKQGQTWEVLPLASPTIILFNKTKEEVFQLVAQALKDISARIKAVFNPDDDDEGPTDLDDYIHWLLTNKVTFVNGMLNVNG